MTKWNSTCGFNLSEHTDPTVGVPYKLNTKHVFVDPFGVIYLIGATVYPLGLSCMEAKKTQQEKELDKTVKKFEEKNKLDKNDADIKLAKRFKMNEERSMKIKKK